MKSNKILAEKYQQVVEADAPRTTGTGRPWSNPFRHAPQPVIPPEDASRGPQFDRKRHGGLFDRGGADYYYGRAPNPHWWPMATGNGKKITDLSPEEIAEYNAGYDDAERDGDRKNWD
jgi:hypothetical protein